jgi:enoyl-CoA hydratase/carnithine racemase
MTDLESWVDAGRLVVQFHRPQALNALTPGMLDAAAERIRAAGDDDTVRVVVVTGAGRAFCSGADMVTDRDSTNGEVDLATLDAANALVLEIVRCPKPVVAAINGPAAGVGATIALSCDLQVARSTAYLLLAFANIGLMPDGGATAIVPAMIGRARASRMALLGERIPAQQALDWGLITHVAQDETFDDELAVVVDKLAGGPTLAYAHTKAAITHATLESLEQAQARERKGQLELLTTADFAEGRAAFRGRRPAEFRGR